MISSRISAVVGAIAALVVATVTIIESDKLWTWLRSENFSDVSNGDVLSIIQLVLLFFVYREVRHMQQALMGRGIGLTDRKPPDS